MQKYAFFMYQQNIRQDFYPQKAEIMVIFSLNITFLPHFH